MIEETRARYGGTTDEAYWDDVCKHVTGLAYGGMFTIYLYKKWDQCYITFAAASDTV